MIKAMLIAGCGGFVGTCGRYLVGKISSEYYLGMFPLGTFLVNIIGCFIIGILFGLCEKTNIISSNASLLLITGFCGGFTTFSTFADDVWKLGAKGEYTMTIMYVIASIIIGVMLVWLGRALVK